MPDFNETLQPIIFSKKIVKRINLRDQRTDRSFLNLIQVLYIWAPLQNKRQDTAQLNIKFLIGSWNLIPNFIAHQRRHPTFIHYACLSLVNLSLIFVFYCWGSNLLQIMPRHQKWVLGFLMWCLTLQNVRESIPCRIYWAWNPSERTKMLRKWVQIRVLFSYNF